MSAECERHEFHPSKVPECVNLEIQLQSASEVA